MDIWFCFMLYLPVEGVCVSACVHVACAHLEFIQPSEGIKVLSSFLCRLVLNIDGQLQVPTVAMKTSPAHFIPCSHPLPASAFPNHMLLMAGFISPFMFLARIVSIAVNS